MSEVNTLGLFEGIGGFARAAQLLGGFRHGQFVEINPHCQKVLAKNFPGVPIWSDICDYHPRPGEFDLITGG